MFHRITLEAGKLNDARLVKLNSQKAQPPDADRRDSLVHYQELSFAQETGAFFRGNKLPMSFFVYLLLGSIFYYFDYKKKMDLDVSGRDNFFVYGFYEVSCCCS
jgi:hypothetical protein